MSAMPTRFASGCERSVTRPRTPLTPRSSERPDTGGYAWRLDSIATISAPSETVKGSRDERAEGAADELACEGHLVAVVAERLRRREDRLGRGEAGVVVERAPFERLVRRRDRPGGGRHAAEHDAHVVGPPVLDLRRRGDGHEREAPGLAIHRLEERAASLERRVGDPYGRDELALLDRVLLALPPARCDEELAELQRAPADAGSDLDLRVVRDQRRREIGRSDHHALRRTEDRVIAVLAFRRETARAAFEPAGHGLVAEVPAAVALE